MSLDVENQNTGYRLGRLFAVLEEIQQKANPGINTTVRERFYASASAAPVTVFPNLLRLKQHHLGKLKAPHYFENIIENIMSGISSFPAHLSLNDQGMFAIGYYHQKNAMYVFKETDN